MTHLKSIFSFLKIVLLYISQKLISPFYFFSKRGSIGLAQSENITRSETLLYHMETAGSTLL